MGFLAGNIMKKIKTIDIEIALMSHFYKAYIIVPRTYVDHYEVDICMLNKNSLYATEIEIKVSK